MPMYALTTIPLINHLNVALDLKQVLYADDATTPGSLSSLRTWWDYLSSVGPAFSYHANATKTWLLTKEDRMDRTKVLFGDTNVNITTHGRPHLGTPLGSNEFVHQFLAGKVNQWTQELLLLSDIARAQPHTAFAAFTHSYVHKFSFLCRTTPNIEALLHQLEDCIQLNQIPSLTGTPPPNNLVHDLLALPARLGGLSITNPTSLSSIEFDSSISIASPLSSLIASQCEDYSFESYEAQINAKKSAQQQQYSKATTSASTLKNSVPESLQRAMDLTQEKGASSWLTALPLEELNLSLHKGAFRDAVALRSSPPTALVDQTSPCNMPCSAQRVVVH